MADIIRIKRRSSGAPGAPTALASAELAYNEVDHTLYYGEGNSGGNAITIAAVAGQGMAYTLLPVMNGTASAGSATQWSRGDHVHPTDTTRAPTASPTFTGTVTMTGATTVLAPTVTPATDSTTKVATTAFVQSAISAISAGVTSIAVTNGLSVSAPSGAVTIGITANGIANASLAQMSPHTYKGNNTGSSATPIDVPASSLLTDIGAAPLASPAFTGTPTAPTAGSGTATTQIATTAFVMATRIDQLQPPIVDVNWNNHRITGLSDPAAAQDAATKSYVDSTAQGLDTKTSVTAATTANITLSGTQTIDGVAVVAGNRVLVKDQTTQSQNGIWVVAAAGWSRGTDTDTWNELVSAYVFVQQGTANGDTGWVCTVDPGGTIGTTAVTWAQFSSTGTVAAGNGLTRTGNVFDVVGTANRIAVFADNIDIAATYVGQTSITTLGTIVTGTWNGVTVGVGFGGTGASTFSAGYVKASGTSPFTTSATIPNSDISGLGTMALQNANAVAITGGTIDGITIDGGVF